VSNGDFTQKELGHIAQLLSVATAGPESMSVCVSFQLFGDLVPFGYGSCFLFHT